MKTEQINMALDWRYATKKYDPTRTISTDDWKTLEQSLLKAPSSYGLQPVKYLVIETPSLRAQLREVSWNQSQITDASKLIVLLSKESIQEGDIQEYVQRTARIRGVQPESLEGFKDTMVENLTKKLSGADALAWTRRQAYIAMGFLLETAALLHIDATPIEGIDPAAYDKILELGGTGYKSVAVVALGYRHKEDAYQNLKKVRREKSDILQYR